MFKRSISYWDRKFLNEQSKSVIPASASMNAPKKLLSAHQTAKVKYLPAGKMITREFIHNSLYHPDYGYFSKQAQVFTFPVNINVSALRDNDHFFTEIAKLYSKKDPGAQAWHTPTELFQPHYGIAIAKYLVEQYKLSQGEKFLVFEVGAGNGTLMKNIMEYLKKHEIDIFINSNYTIIEISNQLSQTQHNTLKSLDSDIQNRVRIVAKSIFAWDTFVESPCFLIGLEVMDNLSHDVIRYDAKTGEPYQGVVTISEDGDFEEEYTKELDPLVTRYLQAETEGGAMPCKDVWEYMNSFSVLKSNLTDKRYIPTNCFLLFETLAKYFPHHHLLLSDFHTLPDSIEGKNGPVVQTRYENEMVPVSTYLVQPGYFDIFFPTDFDRLNALYKATNNKTLLVKSHGRFISIYGDLQKTKTKSGDNPMVQYYENVSFATTKL